MARRKQIIDPRTIGKPLETSVRENLRDPGYRRHYMLYQVRAAIATAIKSLRELRGLTQGQLADRAKIAQSQIARLESLKDARIPRLEHLVKIFAALDSRAILEVVPSAGTRAEKQEIILV